MHVAYIATGDQLAPSNSSPLASHETQERDLPPHIIRGIQRVATWREGIFSTLTKGSRPVLVELLRCATWHKPQSAILIGNYTLAMRLGASIATVKRGLKFLEESGWISREQLRTTGNKFMGSATTLSPQAIESLGLTTPLPSSTPFFRGSDVSHTIGDPVIQSSTKRQQSQQAASGPPEISSTSDSAATPQESLKIDSKAKQPSIKEDIQTPEESQNATAPSPERTIEPKLFCRALNGNTIMLPKTLEPLLQRLAPHQICRLMGDARRAGHRLEDISITCEKPILASKSPMAYLRRLISCNKDWAWIRNAGQRQAATEAKASQEAKDMATRKALQQQFQQENADRYFVKNDRSCLYFIDSFSCTEWSMETGRSGNMAISEKFIAAVHDGRLVRIEPIEARASIERCKAALSVTRSKVPSPARTARGSFRALADLVG